MSDSSSDIPTSESEEENKYKKICLDDRSKATSKFYTKDESHEDLPYVANNVNKKHKSKTKRKKNKKKSSHSIGQLTFKVCFLIKLVLINIII